jgi:hypothetical protein
MLVAIAQSDHPMCTRGLKTASVPQLKVPEELAEDCFLILAQLA